jgi:putative ABC transport system permease protein
MFSFASLPVDHARADIWVGSPEVASVDLGRPIREGQIAHLLAAPEVQRCETYLQGFAYWVTAGGRSELCMIVGTRLDNDGLASPPVLTPELRDRLTEPGTVIVDDSDLDRLGIQGIGDVARISDRRVRVLGIVHGMRGIAGAYVFCSIETARPLLYLPPGQTIYFLARCHDPTDAATVVERLQRETSLSVFTSAELSRRSRIHWLIKTKAGIALGWAAALGLLVGALVTNQTLYGATVASLREYAVLWALGIPNWRMAVAVLTQSFWVGVTGNCLALPVTLALARTAHPLGVQVLLPHWLLASAAAVTMVTAMLSGLAALRPLHRLEPAILLR